MQLRRESTLIISLLVVLLLNLTVAAHEAVNATGGVNERALTRVEGVRGVRDFDFYHRVSFA